MIEKSLAMVTSLAPVIGYDKAAEIAKKAHHENTSLKEMATKLGYVTNEEYDSWVVPSEMV